MEEVLDELESGHSDIAQKVLIGTSLENRQINALKISDNVQLEENEPAVLFLGCHHAREWISVEVPLLLARHLIQGYDSDPGIRRLVRESEIWIVPLVNPDVPVFIVFPIICLTSLIFGVVALLATKPVDSDTLAKFYRLVKPFGLWGPVRQAAGAIDRTGSDNLSRTIINTLLGMAAILGAYMAPMFLVGHWYTKAGLWAAITAACITTLRFTWYNHLPEADAAG